MVLFLHYLHFCSEIVWSVNVLSPLHPLRPCSFQLFTAVLKFLHNVSRSLLCYEYGYQASAVTENLCTQEGYRCVSNAYNSGKRGFTSSSSGRALQGRLKSIHAADSVPVKRWPLVKADKVVHVLLPKWEITFAGTNSWVIVLLTEVKRLSSTRSWEIWVQSRWAATSRELISHWSPSLKMLWP